MKIKLTTLLIVLVLLVIGGLGAYFLLKDKNIGVMKSTKNDNGIVFNNTIQENSKAEISNDNENNILANEKKTETNKTEENQTEKSLYEKYDGLYWQFRDSKTDKTKLEWNNKKIQIENGVAYLYYENCKTPINSIIGKAKSINIWGEQTLQRVYILTEEGTIWKSICEDDLNSNFVKVNMNVKVLDMTNGKSSIRVVEPPYFLLANGNLVNEEGSSYEELNGNFIKSLGNADEKVFIKADNTMYIYDYQQKKYMQIKDENNHSVKMKDAFIQWSSIHNNLVQETGGYERIFVITEDNKLLYFDGYSNVIAKEYKETAGKIIKNAVEEEQKDEYGGHIINIKITFTDGTEKLLKDANRNFFEN